MKLTLELLTILGACDRGIDFATRNGFIGCDLNIIKSTACIGYDHEFYTWIRFCISEISQVETDEDGRIILIATHKMGQYITCKYENGLMVEHFNYSSRTRKVFKHDGNTVSEHRYNMVDTSRGDVGKFIGYTITENGIMIEGNVIRNGEITHNTSFRKEEDVLTVYLYTRGRISEIKKYVNGVIVEISDKDRTEYTLFENGKVVYQKESDTVSFYQYDEQNRMIKQSNLCTYCNDYDYIYTYDENKTTKTKINIDGVVLDTSVWEYDDHKNVIRQESECGSYSVVKVWKNKYKDGMLVETVEYDGDGKLESKMWITASVK